MWTLHSLFNFRLDLSAGTGKTKTIVEAVFQILRHHPRTHILVCGASNSSADTLASRLSHYLAPDILFRLNDPSRSVSSVQSALDLDVECF